MDLGSVRRAYKRYAPFYDNIFGPLMNQGRVHTVRAVNHLGPARVLEVGVGTGLSLPHYRSDDHILGIDVSTEMLDIARQRIQRSKLANAEVHEMDAEALDLPDHSFDVVVAMYVLSVVPHPERCIAEMRRVCRPGGHIFICNHFVDGDGPSVSRVAAPLGRWLGWRPDFGMEVVRRQHGLEILSRRKVKPLNLFTILECRNGPR